jgi:hypothetical protein
MLVTQALTIKFGRNVVFRLETVKYGRDLSGLGNKNDCIWGGPTLMRPALRIRAERPVLRKFKISIFFFIFRPPLWSSGQSSRLQIQRSGFDSWHYHFFWEAMGLERDPLSLVSTIE